MSDVYILILYGLFGGLLRISSTLRRINNGFMITRFQPALSQYLYTFYRHLRSETTDLVSIVRENGSVGNLIYYCFAPSLARTNLPAGERFRGKILIFFFSSSFFRFVFVSIISVRTLVSETDY